MLNWRTMTDRPSTEFAVYTRYSNTGSGMPATGGVYDVQNSEYYTKTSKSCLNLQKAACLYVLYTHILLCLTYIYMHYIIISLCELFAVIIKQTAICRNSFCTQCCLYYAVVVVVPF